MNKIIFVLIALIALSCDTDKQQMETLKERAQDDLITQLQLPEGTVFNDDSFSVNEEESDLEGVHAVYTINVTVKSQDKTGNEINKTYTLEYEKVGEGGLDPNDYELKSFN